MSVPLVLFPRDGWMWLVEPATGELVAQGRHVEAHESVRELVEELIARLLIYKRGLRALEPGLLLLEDYDRNTGKLYARRVKGSLSGLHLLQRDFILA